VFDFVADYRRVPGLLDGVNRWEPIGRKARGVGARYRVEVGALRVPLRGVLAITEWNEPLAIGWTAEQPRILLQGRWTFVRRPGGVEAKLKITYELPVALLGNLLAGPIEALLARRIEAALLKMKAQIESHPGE
jgi:ribosome-associated toxin RatA of RatAB toxin-antitoxin module